MIKFLPDACPGVARYRHLGILAAGMAATAMLWSGRLRPPAGRRLSMPQSRRCWTMPAVGGWRSCASAAG
jgi:hypothetical protein